MPKLVLDDYLGGLIYQDRNIPTNQFYIGDGIDIYSDPGYLRTGLQLSTITKSDDTPQVISTVLYDMAVDSLNSKVYFHGGTNLYQMSAIAAETFNGSFNGAGNPYYSISGAQGQVGHGALALYPIGTLTNLFFTWDGTANGDVGVYDVTAATFDPDYMSTVPSGAGKLQHARHPMVEWQGYLWIGNGQYVAKYDGQGTPTVNLTKLNLPAKWECTALLPTRNYLAVAAWVKGVATQSTPAKIFFFDGVNSTYSFSVSVEENFVQQMSFYDGDIFFIGQGRQEQAALHQLTDYGSKKIMALKHIINSSEIKFSGIYPGSLAVANNQLYIGGADERAAIFTYGKIDHNSPNIFSMPHLLSTVANDRIICIKQITSSKIFVSWRQNSGPVFFLSKINLAGTTRDTARYKSGYYDFGQKVRLNYIKFYFKTLASGDSITPTLDLDYGTSFTLIDRAGNTTIAFATDGAVNSKLFNIKKECHSFRIALSFTAGAISIAKIVIDYSFVGDYA